MLRLKEIGLVEHYTLLILSLLNGSEFGYYRSRVKEKQMQ